MNKQTKTSKPKLVGFAATKDHLHQGISAGLDHVILDHPSLSIRCWESHTEKSIIPVLNDLTQEALKLNPNIDLSLNVDMLAHHSHDVLLANVSQWLQENPHVSVRVQDISLLYHFHHNHHCVFDAQIGNANWVSVQQIEKYAQRQCLSMDIAHPDIVTIYNHVPTALELMVHGTICIQYSQRRFMDGFFNEKGAKTSIDQYHQLAEDSDYPGRRFTFLDNQHGHFMFAYFDRSLLNDLTTLKQLPLTHWTIDTRGQDPHYQQACIKAYRYAIDHSCEDSDINLEGLIKQVTSCSPKPLKPGFFRANQTDRRRYKKRTAHLAETETVIGSMLDIWEKKWVIIQCHDSLEVGDVLDCKHPKLNNQAITITDLFDISHNRIKQAHIGQLIKIPWEKGMQQQTLLVKKIQ